MILLENKPPAETIIWVLVIYFMPVVGIGLYFLIGINWKKRKLMKQLPEELFGTYLEPILNQQRQSLKDIHHTEEDSDIRKTISLLLQNSHSPITTKNHCRFFFRGDEKIAALIADLRNARHSIHMEYFIWRSDALGCEIADVLIAKAKEGVEVRLLFDGVGSLGRISARYRRRLKEAGVEYRYFLGLEGPIAFIKLNYCNHRKIAVIDGRIGYTGGMNIGI